MAGSLPSIGYSTIAALKLSFGSYQPSSPSPHGIGDSELARLELQRFFDALAVALDSDDGHPHRPLLIERVTGVVGK